jgi:prepilin-type N-terminal cleavage/methylation domain-containing protein
MTDSSRSVLDVGAVSRHRGFSLVELAVVLAIVALILSTLMFTLSAQTEQRQRDETSRRLNEARDLLVAFVIVNGRLPCPASGGTSGIEADAPAGSGICSAYLNGFLPGRAVGFQPLDKDGYALDAWGNPIRYALARTAIEPSTTSNTCTAPIDHAFSITANLKANGVGCAPANLVICDATQNTNAGPGGVTPPSCGAWGVGGDALPVTNQRTVVAVLFSTGKTGALGTQGNDEAENTDGDGVFVWHDARPAGALGGAYDDMMVWLPAGQLYNRMIAGGLLP